MEFREIQDKLRECHNVLKMARKPSREEFLTTTKVAIAVMFIVGLIGFAVYLLMEILPRVFK